MNKINVIHFQRKPRPGFNFSFEEIFKSLRSLLNDRVNFSVKFSSCLNNGYFSKLWNIIEAGFRQQKNAVLHITGETHFLDLLMRRQQVLLTIHDCRFMERKTGIQKKLVGWLYLKAPVRNAACITAVSEASKKDVIQYTGCSADKITVIPVAINPVFKPSSKTFNKKKPVILQVGTGENKNLSRLAEALQNIPCTLVIIGELQGWLAARLKHHGIDFINKYNLATEELYLEYVHCDIVAFVSTFEGFGMPVIEANCVGRAVITSNLSSLPEIAGNAACLVNPYDIEDIKQGFLKVINDDNYREQIICNGRKNKDRFNENIIANAYFDLYKKIAADLIRNNA